MDERADMNEGAESGNASDVARDMPPERGATIVVLATGGTIASTAPAPDGMAEYHVTETIESLLAAVPGAGGLGPLLYEQLWNVESHAIDNAMLLALAARAEHWLADPSVGGLVVTHGTDTLEETAFFLDLAVGGGKPIVMVGAMRPASALSADGPLNLHGALLVARHPEARQRGTLVVMNDRVHEARHVTKAHTTAVDAFVSREPGCAGHVHDGRVRWHRPAPRAARSAPRYAARTAGELPRVDILYDHQGAAADLYAASVAAGAKGIVIAGCGNGSLSPGAAQGAALAVQAGVPCVRASRSGAGAVSARSDDPAKGLIPAGDLNPQKARILLMLALRDNPDPASIRQAFDGI